MKENRSELKLITAVVVIWAMQAMGIDIQEIIALFTSADNYLVLIKSKLENGDITGNLVVPAVVGVYTIARTYLKGKNAQGLDVGEIVELVIKRTGAVNNDEPNK